MHPRTVECNFAKCMQGNHNDTDTDVTSHILQLVEVITVYSL
jgi:hypothetical protein